MSFSYIKNIKDQLNNNADFVCRELQTNSGVVYLLFLKSMTDINEVSEQIIQPIFSYKEKFDINTFQFKVLKVGEVQEIDKKDVINNILQNKIIIKFNDNYLAIDLEKYPTRVPAEPPTSPNIYGPREGFVEDIKTNICLIRKRLPSINLVFEQMNVGRETNTKVQVVYLKNIANKKVVKKITERIRNIDIDGIVDSYYIAEFLKERPESMFEQCGYQEKPDVVVAKLLEGRIAIIVDGSPIVLTVPYMVFEDLQSSNDYYTNYVYVNLIRIIRTIGILIATIIPGLYLSIRLYSYTVLPINYIVTIANSTKNLPFTPLLEIAFILLLFQILYEVSLRLPQYLGLATSIVGALVLGDTGVKAGLISPPGVIIVAVSIMSIYTIPSQASQLTVLRAIFVILGATLGILGIVGGLIYFINYINSINVYNTPYLSPYSPRVSGDLKDGLFKKPLSKMKQRPMSINQTNPNRQKNKEVK